VPPFFQHPASLDHDTGPGHPERADRIRAIEARLSELDWLGFAPREAPRASEEQLLRVHPAAYVDRVRKMSAISGAFDADTPTSPGSFEAALRAAGGACALVEALLGGGESTGFSALRPPGHHAEPERAMGFCLFANAATAARHALDALGCERVWIIDWDVHHGNGTNTIFHASAEVLFTSIHQYPFWPGSGPLEDVGSGDGEGYSFNLPVPGGTGDGVFLSLVEHVCAPAVRAFRPGLILISAGYDAHRADPLGGLALSTEAYGALARQVRMLGEEVGAPVGVLLEGGYDLEALAASVAATMQALTEDSPPPAAVERHALAERAAAVLGRYWDL
jgi:acetoin utilization deacetylase AcuC-like enzyme